MPIIIVRTVTGQRVTLDAAGTQGVSQLVKQLGDQQPALSGAQLYFKGALLSGKQTLNSLQLGDGDFLVAVPSAISGSKKARCSKSKRREQSSAERVDRHDGARSNNSRSTGEQPEQDAVDACDQGRQAAAIDVARHRTSPLEAAGGFARTPATAAPRSPAGFGSLLPGYLSRPNPSPYKPQRQQPNGDGSPGEHRSAKRNLFDRGSVSTPEVAGVQPSRLPPPPQQQQARAQQTLCAAADKNSPVDLPAAAAERHCTVTDGASHDILAELADELRSAPIVACARDADVAPGISDGGATADAARGAEMKSIQDEPGIKRTQRSRKRKSAGSAAGEHVAEAVASASADPAEQQSTEPPTVAAANRRMAASTPLETRYGRQPLQQHEADALVLLPLAVPLQRFQAIFTQLNVWYAALLNTHNQPTWYNVGPVLRNFLPQLQPSLQDLKLMSELVPEVMVLRDRTTLGDDAWVHATKDHFSPVGDRGTLGGQGGSAEAPAAAAPGNSHPSGCACCHPHPISQAGASGDAEEAQPSPPPLPSYPAASNTYPHGPAELCSSHSGGVGMGISSDGSPIKVRTGRAPLDAQVAGNLSAQGWAASVVKQVAGARLQGGFVDGAGTVPHGEENSYLIEIVDPGRRGMTTAVTDDEADDADEARLGDDPSVPLAGRSKKRAKKAVSSAISNGLKRRERAFTIGLAFGTWLVHEQFLLQLQRGLPLEQQRWRRDGTALAAQQPLQQQQQQQEQDLPQELAAHERDSGAAAPTTILPAAPAAALETRPQRQRAPRKASTTTSARKRPRRPMKEAGLAAAQTGEQHADVEATHTAQPARATRASKRQPQPPSHAEAGAPAAGVQPDAAGHGGVANFGNAADGDAVEWDAIQRRAWHPLFDVSKITLADVRTQVNTHQQRQQRLHRLPSRELQQAALCARPPCLSKRHPPCTDTSPLGPVQFLEHLRGLPWYCDQMAHVEEMPARQARYADTAQPLSPAVLAALAAKGISQLFTHQAHAIDSILSGRNVVIATSTASGKSLCYNLPVLEALAADTQACALFMFPTKALAQDQLRALRELCGAAFGADAPCVEIYDGDTPQAERPAIRDRAQLLITNPDMLHMSVLPVHRNFARVLSNLRYVVVDEGHAYKGVFGCHTALVLRRLRRLCRLQYNANPVYVVTSATIANPQQHAQELLGVEGVVVVDDDGSPHGPKSFVMWNPPLSLQAKIAAARAQDLMTRNDARKLVKYSKKAERDAKREQLREANAVRSRGSQMGPGRGVTEADLAAALALSSKRGALKRELFEHPRQPAAATVAAAASAAEAAVAAGATTGGGDAAARHVAGDPAVSEDPEVDSSGPESDDPANVEPRALQEEDAGHPEAVAIDDGGSSRESPAELLARAQRAVDIAGGSRVHLRGSGRGRVMRGAGGDTRNGGLIDVMAERPVLRRRLWGVRLGAADTTYVPRDGAQPGITHEVAAATAMIQASMPGSNWKERDREAHKMEDASTDQRRDSPIVEMSRLLAEVVQHGLRTIAFCKTRKLCELVAAYTRETLKVTAPERVEALKVYRAGYSPEERRSIERGLHSGTLYAVAATNALELGVDVGSLDCTLHLGFPGSVSSLWQQAGRAGRREQPSLSIYIGFDGPLDQHFMRHPRELLERPIENAQVDANNPHVLQQHVLCAAAELPLYSEEDARYFNAAGLRTATAALAAAGLLARHPGDLSFNAMRYTGPRDNPAADISLRTIDPDRYQIVNEVTQQVMEDIEASAAFWEVYDGAVYMFQGRTYLCKRLDLDARVALVRPVDVKYYTKVRDYTDVHVTGGRVAYPVAAPAKFPTTSAVCESALVTVRYMGFHRVWQGSGTIFDTVDLFLPDVQFETQAAYIRVPHAARAAVTSQGLSFREAVHAAEHAILNVLPLYMMCNPTDVATECDNPYDTRYRPERLLFYDKHPGGIGLAAQATPMFQLLLDRALKLVQECPCVYPKGCPGCVQHLDCQNYNAVLNKAGAVIVLEHCIAAEKRFEAEVAARRQEQDALMARFMVAPNEALPVLAAMGEWQGLDDTDEFMNDMACGAP